MPAILLYGAAFLLYAALALHFWRTRWRGASVPRVAPWERAAILAPLMTLMERRLHGGALAGPLAALPPLLTMERLLFQILLAGFVFLTLTLATGIAFSETLFGRAMKFDHKTVFAVASWLIFAALLAGRYLYGWRGRVALRWTLVGFVALLLAYVGSRFVLEVILRRGLV